MRESLALEAAADDLLARRGFDVNGAPMTRTPIAELLELRDSDSYFVVKRARERLMPGSARRHLMD